MKDFSEVSISVLNKELEKMVKESSATIDDFVEEKVFIADIGEDYDYPSDAEVVEILEQLFSTL
jgi:hypothetical protein